MLKSSQTAFESAVPPARGVSRPIGERARKRVIAALIIAPTLAWSTLASALGLGEITLHSALNQPLNAEIQLLETGGLSAEDVVARLASPEAFAKANIERVFFLNDLRFTPVMRGDRGVIRVVSSKPVTEPYLNFLVQLARPNGDLLHEYTLLLDPANSPQGLAATRSRHQSAASAADASRMPVAPPSAVQGKRYTIARGDTLDGIAQRLQGRDSKMSVAQLADGIRALNPQIFPEGSTAGLKTGQSLLLPDAAVLPRQAAPVAASAATASTQTSAVEKASEQLAAAALESQQLNRAVEELTAQAVMLQQEMISKDKEITALRADLAQAPAQPQSAQPAAAPVPAAPVAPVPVAQPSTAAGQDTALLNLPLLLGVLLLIVLLLVYAYTKRRQRKHSAVAALTQEELLIKPAQAPVVPIYEVPAVAAQPVAVASGTQTPRATATPRLAGAAPDALDGVSIYIAYGRFSEALGILRNALETQPERDDIRIRILELLAEQGDVTGFASAEQAALEHGLDPQKIQEIRARFPQLNASEAPASVPSSVGGSALATAALAAPLAVEAARPPATQIEPDSLEQLDETTAAALNPEHADEFQLNLDDLSMDADWDLVDPFEAPPVRTKAASPAPEIDPGFASNLTELPEVFELSDDQFLSDFDEPEVQPEKIELSDSGEQADGDALSDEFLDSFMGDDSEFDLLDLDEAPLTQINQAQVLIDDGDFDAARQILLQVIEESDEQHRRMARDLLAGIS